MSTHDNWKVEYILQYYNENLTVRDRMAMAALTGLLATMAGSNAAANTKVGEIANAAYNLADAMMRRRQEFESDDK